jgi:predicted nucleic acid-binding protein
LRLVVDSSVVLKWFVDEPQRELAAALLDSDDVLIAPDLALSEVTNALWRKARKGEVTPLQVAEAIHEIGSILVLRPVTPEMTETAFQIAQTIGHSIYDCLFLACAMQEEAELITADAKFLEKLTQQDLAMKVRQLSPA